jgi:CYTH domain-containing protein
MDRVSLILRKYLESRFAIKSTRQTTREFLHNLNKSSADPEVQSYKGELQTCLEQCDMAKFAHQIPQQQNMEMMESAIISFVEKTRPIEQSKGETV